MSRYREACNQLEYTPILLFNEADAILGIRQEGAQRAVEQMENSLQNIILQEMEQLEGILIATTNLTCNLDKAFERRFLYKVRFEKPKAEIKQKIWQNMIPQLKEEESFHLSQCFDFSGGEIENIYRKIMVDTILYGNTPNMDQIINLCKEESLKEREKFKCIGY